MKEIRMMLVTLVSVLALAIGMPLVALEQGARAIAPNMRVQLIQPAGAFFDPVALLVTLAGGVLNDLFFPQKTDAWGVAAPSVVIEDKRGRRTPSVTVLRQQLLMLEKGSRIVAIKPGINGQPIREMYFYRDGDIRTQVVVKNPPWEIGTRNPAQNPPNPAWFDTGTDYWQAQEVYMLNLKLFGHRDSRVDGDHPVYAAIPVAVYDHEPFRLAVQDPEYRAALLGIGMAGAPAIPVGVIVDDAGNVGTTLGDGGKPLWLPNQSQGVVQPNQPVAGQQRGGLEIVATHHGQPVIGELRLKRQDLGQPLVFQAGELAASTTVAMKLPYREEPWTVQQKGKGQNISLQKLVPGRYAILTQAFAEDGTAGMPVQFVLVIEE
ncbi:MAG: hypothetical protein ACOYBJ_03065 [Patescibacteria group bacterium]|jgi:hypothetical protein